MKSNVSATRSGIYAEYQVPFCRPIQCSMAVEISSDGQEVWYVNGRRAMNVLWSCLPSECQGYITVLLAVIVMLAVMTITFNCLILGINLASKTRRMRKRNPTINNYSNYVVSLAVADLLLGIIVLPLCVANFYFEFLSNPINFLNATFTQDLASHNEVENKTVTMGEVVGGIPDLINGKLAEGAVTTPSVWEMAANPIDVSEQPPLLIRDMLGLFTHLTLFVSVYTLISASADRFYAASHSIRLSTPRTSKTPHDAKRRWIAKALPSVRRSTVAVVVVWVLGILFAVMPLVMRPYFYFRHIGHVFAAMTSDESYGAGVKWYLFTLAVPLIGMWALNLMICFTLWRRKSQLGLRRRQSLHRKLLPGSSSTSGAKAPALKLASNLSDSVFDTAVDETVKPATTTQRYPASRWNQPEARNSDTTDVKNGARAGSARQKSTRGSGGGSASPPSNQSSLRGSRSGIRRKVSSIRRAKDLLRNQSYEANITKTLCIVVIAFTIAVLPLIVVLGSIARERDSTPKALNNEVTALTCSLLLLFSNSFVNCVIYGARMRDFRTAVGQLFRAFFYRIKNTLCCSCFRGHDGQNFGSENVTSALHIVRQHSPGLTAELRSKFHLKRTAVVTDNESKTEVANGKNPGSPGKHEIDKTVTLTEAAKTSTQQVQKGSQGALTDPGLDMCLFRGRSAIYTRRQHSECSAEPNSISRFSWRSGSLKDVAAHCAESKTRTDQFSSCSPSVLVNGLKDPVADDLDCNSNGIPNYVMQVPGDRSIGKCGVTVGPPRTEEGDCFRKSSDTMSAPPTSQMGSDPFYDASDLINTVMDMRHIFNSDGENSDCDASACATENKTQDATM